MRLSVCLSLAMVPTWRHLQSGAAQTMASSRVKFAQFVENELRHLHVEKRDRWGARWARGTSWKSANLRHRVYILKSRSEISEKCEKALITGRLPGDISVTNGSINKRKTRMRREMYGLAYVMPLDERRVARAVLMAPSVKICVFWAFFTIQVGARKLIDLRCHKRNYTEECTDFKMHRKLRLSFGHNML